MAIKLVIAENTNKISQISLKCKICRVTNLCADPIRHHCIACGQRLSRRYRRIPNYPTARYLYHSSGVD